MRIEDSVFQNEVADSLLGDVQPQQEEVQTSEFAAHGDELLNEALAEQQENVFKLGDEGIQSRHGQPTREVRPEEQVRETEQRQTSEPQGEREQRVQPAEGLTPEQVQQGIASLEADVQQLGLNTAESAQEFTKDFSEALGVDPTGVDIGQLGNMMSKTALSAVNVYLQNEGDPARMPPINEQTARAYAHDLLTAWGLDPRQFNVDARLLTNSVFAGALNFIDTFNKLGGTVTDMRRLNDPQMAEWLLGNVNRALGGDGNVDRTSALKFADACGKQILRVITVMRQANEARQGQGARPGRARAQRVPAKYRVATHGAKIPKFQTNAGPGDPFDPETMATYAERNLRL